MVNYNIKLPTLNRKSEYEFPLNKPNRITTKLTKLNQRKTPNIIKNSRNQKPLECKRNWNTTVTKM